MHILFITHHYLPESNAPANRVSEFAQAWAGQGHRVTVVTTTPSQPGGRPFPGYSNPVFRREMLNGVEVLRLGTFLAANKGVVRRSLNFLSFLISVILNLPRLPTPDVVVSTSPQLLAGIAGAAVARAKRRPWVFEVRDIWPDSILAVGAAKHGPIIRFLEQVEAWAYRTADQVVAVSPAFGPYIEQRASLRRPVAIIENGANLHLFVPPDDGAAFRKSHGLEGKLVFGYVGTHGMAHRLETIIEAAELTRDDPSIAYLMVGSGAERERLAALKSARALDNVVMLEHQPRAAIPQVWSNIDVSLVLLRRTPTFCKVIPSKMFEAMAMGLPILLGVDGQARSLMEEGGCGMFVEPEDGEALAAAVRTLAADPALRQQLGACGREFVRKRYDRRVLARRYIEVLDGVLAPALEQTDVQPAVSQAIAQQLNRSMSRS